jgi:uncharacterized protein (DUF362 family)
MDRRNFIKKSVQAGFAAGIASSFGNYSHLFADQLAPGKPDLVAIKGGQPDVMFDKAIQYLGGMKSFIKKGQLVVIKPNIGWDVSPEGGANTNPLLINRIIKHCLDAGAKDVYVFDHTCDNWNRCYTNSGIEKAVKDAGGKLVPANSESYFHEIKLERARNLTNAKIHELILNSDVFINVPVLKEHGSAGLTICMKNLMGAVWDRRFWHGNGLHQCIADFPTYRKPDLNIVDAYYVMKRNGPRGTSKDDLVEMKSQIISTDIVAADTAAAKLFGINPDTISYIKMADELKVGTKDLNKLSIKRIIM